VQRQVGRFVAITPRADQAMAVGGAEAKRAFDAMMTMKKIDVAAIKAARAAEFSLQEVYDGARLLRHADGARCLFIGETGSDRRAVKAALLTQSGDRRDTEPSRISYG